MALGRQIQGVLGQFHHQILIRQSGLAAETGFRLQPPRLVQHVVFQLAALFQRIEAFTHDAVAGGAGAAHLTGVLDLDAIVGQQQRGAIARAIVQGAQAILADEPVASLDPVSARKVMELLVELNKRDGMGVIVTLHQVDYAIRYCDRVIALQGGKIVYDGPSMGLDQQRLIEIYGPEFEDAFWETKA